MGRAWIFSNNVNTDEIIPGRYNITTDEAELANHVFCEICPKFSKNVSKGDIIVAGLNFGCGSSREHAPIAIKGSGISCIIARSFARIFYRNAVNIGLPLLELNEADEINDGDELKVNIESGIVKNLTTGKVYRATTMPDFILEIVKQGGIVNYLKNSQ